MTRSTAICPGLGGYPRPGLPWQRLIEEEIKSIKSATIFVGISGFGPWQNLEYEGLLRQFIQRECPVIPVLLKTCIEPPEFPTFLDGMTWVDFRREDPDPIKQLIWGITGVRIEI
jgi:TIR domain